MKTIRIFTIVWMWLAFSSHILADELTISEFSIKPSESKEVTVELNNPSGAYVLLEFTMALPEGIMLAKDENGWGVKLNSIRCDDSFSIDVEEISDHNYKFLVYSGLLNNITGNSGGIFTMTLTAASDAETGMFQGSFSEQLFATAEGEGYEPADKTFNIRIGGIEGDVNKDQSVTIADVTAMMNIILGKDNEEPFLYDHQAADMNNSGGVDAYDVTELVNVILEK